MQGELYAIIMAGGSGTRFWPASRKARPKQYLPIHGSSPMLTQTFARLEGLVDAEHTLVVTAASQVEHVRACLPELAAENVLGEPEARNTAPCVGWAAHEVARRNPDAVQVVLPADHVIQPPEAFRRTVAAAAACAREEGALFTFGVRPDHPATGYGYIQTAERHGERDGIAIYSVARFVEKPDRERAEGFLAEGGFYWNAGIFVWSTRAILAAIERYVPPLHAGLQRLGSGEDLAEVYADLPAEPVDIAIMERAEDVRLLPIDYSWSDVGSWAALPGLSAPDAEGNWAALSRGAQLVTHDAKGCVAFAEGERVVALVGVEDLVVVAAGEATLVCPRDRAEEVKAIVEKLKESGPQFL